MVVPHGVAGPFVSISGRNAVTGAFCIGSARFSMSPTALVIGREDSNAFSPTEASSPDHSTEL